MARDFPRPLITMDGVVIEWTVHKSDAVSTFTGYPVTSVVQSAKDRSD